MHFRSARRTLVALLAVLALVAAGCGDDDTTSTDDATDAPTTTEADGDGDGDDSNGTEADDEEADSDEAAVAAFDEIDVCALVSPTDVESLLGDEQVEPVLEESTSLPSSNFDTDAEVVEAIGCRAMSAEQNDAGIFVRLFRFESADDAAETTETLLNGEELDGTQADVAYLNRIPMPEGYSFIVAGSLGDVLILVQAQSRPDQTDPATEVATLNGIISGLSRA